MGVSILSLSFQLFEIFFRDLNLIRFKRDLEGITHDLHVTVEIMYLVSRTPSRVTAAVLMKEDEKASQVGHVCQSWC